MHELEQLADLFAAWRAAERKARLAEIDLVERELRSILFNVESATKANEIEVKALRQEARRLLAEAIDNMARRADALKTAGASPIPHTKNATLNATSVGRRH